jgi:hypothetical protein
MQVMTPDSGMKQVFLSFAATQCAGHSPLYERLATGVADDDFVLGLVASASSAQRRPTLLFAAVHEMLLRGERHPLANHYPSVNAAVASGDPMPAFHDFCRTYRDQLVARMSTGATQTNDVRRSAALIIGLHQVAIELPKPVVLVELGASAGLLLLFDRYRIDVAGRLLGPPDSPVDVLVRADKQTGQLLPPTMPRVADRFGVDLAPVDLDDPDQLRWLEAFVWPEADQDRDRLRAALALARARRPPVVPGDAVSDLPEILAGISEECVPVVFHCTLFSYLDSGQRRRITDCLETVGARRDLGWLPLEAPGFLTAPQLGFAIPAHVAQQNSAFVLSARTWRAGTSTSKTLAQVDPYGRWVRRI